MCSVAISSAYCLPARSAATASALSARSGGLSGLGSGALLMSVTCTAQTLCRLTRPACGAPPHESINPADANQPFDCRYNDTLASPAMFPAYPDPCMQSKGSANHCRRACWPAQSADGTCCSRGESWRAGSVSGSADITSRACGARDHGCRCISTPSCTVRPLRARAFAAALRLQLFMSSYAAAS